MLLQREIAGTSLSIDFSKLSSTNISYWSTDLSGCFEVLSANKMEMIISFAIGKWLFAWHIDIIPHAK